ncbi:MAG: DUF58 domain-containing protein [Balneolales bacterium]
MLITPELLNQLAPLELKARQIVEGFISGLHKSPFYGFSVEFAEHRPYNAGDEIKHIDWKVYGKSEKYFVKQYEEETNLRCHILLDVSSSMNFKHFADYSKLRYAIHFGAALSYLMHRQRDACGFIPFDQEIGSIMPAKSSYSHLQRIYATMEELLKQEDAGTTETRKTATADVLHEVAERLHRRSLVVILSDLFENVQKHDELISALKHLRHRKHEVVLFHMLEKKSERDLDFPDNRYVFQDLETGASIDVMPRQIRKDYQEKMNEYTQRFKSICSQAKIDYEEVDTQSPFDLALLAYLNKRKRLG